MLRIVFGERVAINSGRSEDEVAYSLQEAARLIANNPISHTGVIHRHAN
jgi:hypothetical protein